MNEINDVILSELSQISYIDVPNKLKDKFNQYKEYINLGIEVQPITLQEFSQAALLELDNYFKINEDTGEYSQGDKYAISLLEKYSSEEYSSVKIIDYKNDNGKSGYVGYALEFDDNTVVIASRVSETPDSELNKIKTNGEKISWKDWIDNLLISSNFQTEQQAVAKVFVEDIGKNYSNIYLTGHSKGGNNALYCTVATSTAIRDKIKGTVTFNAPGFSDRFMELNEPKIREMVNKGIIKEIQNENDIVSSIMNNLSNPVIIKSKDVFGKVFFDDHSIWTLASNNNSFQINTNGKKSDVAIFVYDLVKELTRELSDEEINNLAKFIDYQVNKENILRLTKRDIEALGGAKGAIEFIIGISKYALSTGAKEVVEDIPKEFWDRLIKQNKAPIKVMGTKFILEGLVNFTYKSRDKILNSNIIKARNDSMVFGALWRGILNATEFQINLFNNTNVEKDYNIRVKSIDLGEYNMFYYGENNKYKNDEYGVELDIEKNVFLADTSILYEIISIYQKEIDNVTNVLSELEDTMKFIDEDGWYSVSKDTFYEYSYYDARQRIENHIQKMKKIKDYLINNAEFSEDMKVKERKLLSMLE